MVNLTYNEKRVLQLLIEKGNTTNTEICSKLKISKQAVGKIRKKLEENKLIIGYSINLDLKTLGVELLCIIKIIFKVSNPQIQNDFKKWVNTQTDIINARTVFLSQPGMILACGFSDIDNLESFVKELSENAYLSIEEVLVSKIDGILKDSYNDLVKNILKIK